MRRKSPNKESLPDEAGDEIAKEEEANSEEDQMGGEQQKFPFEVDQDEFDERISEDPTSTYTEEREPLGEDIISEISDDALKAYETDIVDENELSQQVDSVGNVDFEVEGGSALAEDDLLSNVEDVEEVEVGENCAGVEDNDAEEVENTEKSSEDAQLVSDRENEALVADGGSVENSEVDQSSRDAKKSEHEEDKERGCGGEAAGGEEAEKSEQQQNQQSVSLEVATEQQQQSGEAAAEEAKDADEAVKEVKDAEEPELEELQMMNNKPRTFLGGHISAGQVKLHLRRSGGLKIV